MARPKRKEMEIEQTRRHIAFSAAAVFAEKGYNSTSMAELAEAAGYSTPSLYKYFTGKEDIVSWLDEKLSEEMFALFHVEYPTSLNFRQRVEMLLQSILSWVHERQAAYSFLLVCEQNKPIEETVTYINELANWIDLNSSLKERCGMSAFDCAVALHGLSYSRFAIWFHSHRDRPPQYLHTLLDFFFAGMEGASKR